MAEQTDLNDIAVFVRVVQLESFSRAARALGMPVSTVSRKVTTLEERLGVTLLQRTTRKLNLTAQGRAYFDQCSEPLSHLYDAERVITQAQNRPEGLLRVSGPVMLEQDPFYNFLSAFLTSYPGIHVDLHFTNEFLDLIADNIDVAIRFGDLRDSSLVAQRLGRSVRYLVASPDYVARHDLPTRPEQLSQYPCVMINGRNNEADWHLVKGRREVTVRVSGPVAAHDFHIVTAFALRGHGIALLPSGYADTRLTTGDLVRVLPDWSSPQVHVHALYPTRRFMPSRLKAFLDALKAWDGPLWLPSR